MYKYDCLLAYLHVRNKHSTTNKANKVQLIIHAHVYSRRDTRVRYHRRKLLQCKCCVN